MGRNPDITLEELARASGVVRRTLFGHFPGRAALLEALVEDASETLRVALADGLRPEESAERALAHFVFAIWPFGDRCRMLVAHARSDLGDERVASILAPARSEVTAILERGQREGVFHARLSPAVLSSGLEAMHFALLEAVNTGALASDGAGDAAVVTLIAAGVPEERAERIVDASGPWRSNGPTPKADPAPPRPRPGAPPSRPLSCCPSMCNYLLAVIPDAWRAGSPAPGRMWPERPPGSDPDP